MSVCTVDTKIYTTGVLVLSVMLVGTRQVRRRLRFTSDRHGENSRHGVHEYMTHCSFVSKSAPYVDKSCLQHGYVAVSQPTLDLHPSSNSKWLWLRRHPADPAFASAARLPQCEHKTADIHEIRSL